MSSYLERAAEKQRRIQQAMFPLIGDDRFLKFMEVLKELKDEAVEFSVSHDGVRDERVSLVSKGEVRTYLNILAVCESYKLQAEQTEATRQERAEQERQEAVGGN